MALFFAVGGTVLLAVIAWFIAAGQPWLVLLASLLTIGFIGYGFVFKAKQRRRQSD
jgi:hypothetical protein